MYDNILYIILSIMISLILLKIGEKIGEHLAKRRKTQELDFGRELKRIIEEWKRKRGISDYDS